jgi:hypothetical protein
VTLYNPSATTGTGSFDDTVSGGFSETLASPTLFGAPAPMNYPGFFAYASAGPHIDSASLVMGLSQAVAGVASIPFFTASGSIAQVAITTGTTAQLGFQFQSKFEGFMVGADPNLALTFLGINISGTVGPTPGEYVNLTMQQIYIDCVTLNNIGTLAWNYSNTTAGLFSATVYPTWTPNFSPVLTGNLIDVQGFITVQADPSSLSFASIVPEPGSLSCILLATGLFAAGARRRVRPAA